MFIYKITNLINNKIYIGQTTKTLDERLIRHFVDARYRQNTHILKAIKKYGKENFIIEKLEKCNFLEELDKREIYWIKKLNSKNRDIGYNITDGGQGTHGYIFTKKIREKIGKKSKGRKHTEETKFKMSKTAKIIHNLPDVKKKNSDGVKKAFKNKEIKRKHKLACKKVQNTPEMKLKQRNAKLGDKNPAKRKEVREKISNTLKLYYKEKKNGKK